MLLASSGLGPLQAGCSSLSIPHRGRPLTGPVGPARARHPLHTLPHLDFFFLVCAATGGERIQPSGVFCSVDRRVARPCLAILRRHSSPAMKLSNPGTVPVYTISGASTARPLPDWLARRRKRSLKDDPEYRNRVELLQDFEFEEASNCIRVSEDGEWVVSTGMLQQ